MGGAGPFIYARRSLELIKASLEIPQFDISGIATARHRQGHQEKFSRGMSERRRLLRAEGLKYEHNAWDMVSLSEEGLARAKEKLERDREALASRSTETAVEYGAWDRFYRKHRAAFFKDRKWIPSEFPGLQGGNKRILEVGCGVGNSLASLVGTGSELFGVDCSESAIRIIKHRQGFEGGEYAVHDAASKERLPYTQMDCALLVFTLSAIDPDAHAQVMKKVRSSLRPGGLLYVRDYGHMDMAQLRFKAEQAVKENFYVRGEGTYAYFFTRERVELLARESGLEIVELKEDRRLLLNRKRRLEMYRSWVQATLRNPPCPPSS